MKGFYVPASQSTQYVASKRNKEGALLYESTANDIGIAKQQAVQALEKNYAQTIENAYASHLAANQGILGSNMGQGYKEAYLEAQRQRLQQEIAETNLTAANARQELGLQEAQAQEQITKAFQTEVGNFDRAAQSMTDYLAYIKTLTSQDGANGYLTDEYKDLGIDELYHVLFNAQPQGFIDVEGNAGMNFLDWTRSKLTTSSSDEAYRQWFEGQGGYQELRTQLSAQSQKRENERKAAAAAAAEEAKKKAEAEEKAKLEADFKEEKLIRKYSASGNNGNHYYKTLKFGKIYEITKVDENKNYTTEKYTVGDTVTDENTLNNLKRISGIANASSSDIANSSFNSLVKYHGDYYIVNKYRGVDDDPYKYGVRFARLEHQKDYEKK